MPLPLIATNTYAYKEQEYIEVDYIWEGFSPHPVVTELQEQLFEDTFGQALELGIKFTLRPEEDIDGILASGNYDIVNYYRPRMPGDDFEILLFTLEDMFVDGLIQHRCVKLERKIVKLHRIYDNYIVAEGEIKDYLEAKFISEFHKIEKILYEKQLIFDYCYFPPLEAPMIFVDKMSVINSAKGNVFSNNHLRLEISRIFDRVFVTLIVQTALDLFGFEATLCIHLFGWSQYHDVSLPTTIP
ncbi:MAG: hypothetical protein HZR80_04735 [Candidatus Heimdallarchaeota archaeon]